MRFLPLRSFQVENFKAIRDSGRVELGSLTVFIGNNGVGKSSFLEALETFRDVVLSGVDAAFSRWRGFEHALNQAAERKLQKRVGHRSGYSHPMKFTVDWKRPPRTLTLSQTITQGPGGNTIFIQNEQIIQERIGKLTSVRVQPIAEGADGTARWMRDDGGEIHFDGERIAGANPEPFELTKLADGESMFRHFPVRILQDWQFLMLNPENMGQPAPQQRATNQVHLAKDGGNVAEYLNAIRKKDLAAFEGLLDAVRHVLPYAADLQPSLTSELQRSFYLKLREETFDIPGWLLSTGTLRLFALLACLRHPKPPALVVVEEIENGLDPRTLQLVVEEIRAAIVTGTIQVILTTHSPYLLDLLDLSQIVVVEREDNEPKFRRPADQKELRAWAKDFSPGRLYTMGRLTRGS